MTSTTDGTVSQGGVKTLAVRLNDEQHAQLTLIAKLLGHSVTNEIRQAIDAHIAAVKSSPDFASRAENVLAEIERDAAARRDAVTSLFGSLVDPETPEEPSTGPARKQRSRQSHSN